MALLTWEDAENVVTPVITTPSFTARSFSLPPASNLILSVSNFMAVFVSPVWNIESAIPTPLVNVETPTTDIPAPT